MMEKLLGKKWFSRDNLLLLVRAGSPVVRHCTAGKKGRQRKGAGEGKCSGDAGRANGIHTDSDRRQHGRICGIS